jgi:steroid delta-isomerase-like uncharacterized protein
MPRKRTSKKASGKPKGSSPRPKRSTASRRSTKRASKRVAPPATLARRWFEEIWNQGRVETIDELIAPDGVAHLVENDVRGPAGFRTFYNQMIGSFSNVQVVVHDVVTDGTKAVARWTAKANHQGDSLGPKATGREVEFSGLSWFEFSDGQLVEGWDSWNVGGLLQSRRS